MRREQRSDQQLVALARGGSPEAFDEIVERYRPALVRYCAGLTRAERVDDAVQQTFLNAWLALERGAPVRELRPWLYSIARNAAYDQHRGQRADLVELSPELAGGADPAHVAAQRDEMSDVLRAVAELPERQRTALLETAVHGRPTEHVADELGMSGGALRQLVHRARTNVRGMVASVLPSPIASWFAQAGGDEGMRRAVALLGGAGQGATAALAAATATVASVGAIGTAGIKDLATQRATTEERAAVSARPADSVRLRASGNAIAASGGSASAPALVRLPLDSAGTVSTAPAASGSRADDGASRAVDDDASTSNGRGRPRGAASDDDDDRSGDDRGSGSGQRRGEGVPAPTFANSGRPRVSAASRGHGGRGDGGPRSPAGGHDRSASGEGGESGGEDRTPSAAPSPLAESPAAADPSPTTSTEAPATAPASAAPSAAPAAPSAADDATADPGAA